MGTRRTNCILMRFNQRLCNLRLSSLCFSTSPWNACLLENTSQWSKSYAESSWWTDHAILWFWSRRRRIFYVINTENGCKLFLLTKNIPLYQIDRHYANIFLCTHSGIFYIKWKRKIVQLPLIAQDRLDRPHHARLLLDLLHRSTILWLLMPKVWNSCIYF